MTVHGATHHEFSIGGVSGTLTTDATDDRQLMSFELWIPDQDEITTGFMEAWYLAANESLRHGMSLAELVQMYLNTKFRPYGPVRGDTQITQASSLVDYIVRRLAFDYLTPQDRLDLMIVSAEPPMCYQCGVQMQRAGSLYACPSCGTTS